MKLETIVADALAREAMVLRLDARGIVLEASERAASLLGEPEVVGRPLAALLSGGGDEVEGLARALRTATAWAGDAARAVEGRVRWVRVTVVPCPGEAGTFVAFGVEASGGVEVKGELRDALDFYENAPCGLHSLDPRGVIVKVNHTWLAWTGYRREEVEGKLRFEEILTPESVSVFRSTFPIFQRDGAIHDLEFTVRRKDGSTLPVLVSATMVRDEEGRFVRTRSVLIDQSERKRAEAANELLNERLRDAVECVQDAFAVYDSDDRLVLCNSAFRGTLPETMQGPILGLTFTELLRQKIETGRFAVGDEGNASFFERRMDYHRAPSGSFETRAGDGRFYRIFERRTREGGTVSVLWDMTEDERREADTREARRVADAASAAKSDFLSSMSHELRTPLNAILGFAQLLELSREPPLSAKQLGYLRHVLRGGEHLLRLIDEVLDLSRIETGSVQVSLEPVEVGSVLSEVVSTLGPMAQSKGVELSIAPLPRALPSVFVDRTRFSQILLNFGSNAVKYNRAGGSVTLVAGATAQGQVRVAVIDTGMGIPAERQGEVFRAFQRLGQEAGPIEGTGIGLVITKRLAERMQGSVGFRSTPGKGSEFWVEFPAHAAAAPLAQTASEAQPSPSVREARTTVLYVEDNPANVALMRELLATLDRYELITAPTAELGLTLARVHRPDVIVLDINLPGMSGLAAIEHLRDMEETRGIPVLALSASAMPRDAVKALSAGFAAYLTKPVKINALLDAFDRCVPKKGAV